MGEQSRFSRPLADSELSRILGAMIMAVVITIALLDVYLGRMSMLGHALILFLSALVAVVLVWPVLVRK
jgi:hypothetical protein